MRLRICDVKTSVSVGEESIEIPSGRFSCKHLEANRVSPQKASLTRVGQGKETKIKAPGEVCALEVGGTESGPWQKDGVGLWVEMLVAFPRSWEGRGKELEGDAEWWVHARRGRGGEEMQAAESWR